MAVSPRRVLRPSAHPSRPFWHALRSYSFVPMPFCRSRQHHLERTLTVQGGVASHCALCCRAVLVLPTVSDKGTWRRKRTLWSTPKMGRRVSGCHCRALRHPTLCRARSRLLPLHTLTGRRCRCDTSTDSTLRCELTWADSSLRHSAHRGRLWAAGCDNVAWCSGAWGLATLLGLPGLVSRHTCSLSHVLHCLGGWAVRFRCLALCGHCLWLERLLQ